MRSDQEPLQRRSYVTRLLVCLAALLAAVLVSPGIGTGCFERRPEKRIALTEAWRSLWSPATDASDSTYTIAFQIRMPQTMLALAAGVTLALCGAVFQTLFRNPLAEPYTLGIASGGSLGALVALRLGLTGTVFLGISWLTLSAFAGACGVVGLVALLARGSRRLSTNELLLAGVTVGLFCSAMMLAITYFSNARETFEIIRWMMGSLEGFGFRDLTGTLPLLIPAWVVLVAQARALNQYRLGDELAASRGVNVGRLQVVCVLFCSLATAAIVSICGPIGFTGLVVPHIVRLAVGRDCRILLPASALVGGAFLIVCHWISQLALGWYGELTGRQMGSITLPIGVVTAVIGVPVFVTLLRLRGTRG